MPHSFSLPFAPCRGGPPALPERLVDLDAVYAYGDPAANLCDPSADWGFFGEGGMLTFMDFRSIDPGTPGTSTPLPNGTSNEFELADEFKTVQIGSLGVRPAEMLCHPNLDLTGDADDPDSVPHPVDDANDIIFIAGGRLGLWAIEAHPAKNYSNRAVRIDDSGNLNVSTQSSRRYCN
ncbi:MAG: hypothetical protein AAGG01_22915, partial [Planctomycetota bacterium]